MVKLKWCAKIPSSGLRCDVTLFYYQRLTSYASTFSNVADFKGVRAG
jgi:hypothetical protein